MGDRRQVAVLAELGQMRRLRLAGALLRAGAVAEQDAPLGGLGHRLQHLEVRADGLHQPVARPHGLGDFHEFHRVRERPRNRTAIRQLVRRVAVGGEADGAAVHGLRHHVRHLRPLFRRCLFFHGAFAHDVEAHRAVADHASHVERRIQALDGVQVAAVVFPVPRQAVEDGVLGNVLHGLHHGRQQFHVGRLAGREGDAAVAEQGGGHAVPAHRRHLRVPADLRVQVRVQIDEAGRDGQPLGVDLALALAVDLADSRDGRRRRWRGPLGTARRRCRPPARRRE